ncbi:RNA polymerase recycling motor HelD [Tumebacillus permanentifrigoris]|uniref:DNA helicase-2/ATP-dependent DNA helicase PcrA n=1 Tax=Tumebacillus permanentifrigoris TaxID=378543 RepID=A0A316DF39_9BACL|nr:RNA polymerase recycling motor HelD [Tumebacillus permanentifrigoris]PWK16565.1 DNA helicase-2/ATP-dependent DNA helicase PcrA [Tumebacillus permanentifrigoris]
MSVTEQEWQDEQQRVDRVVDEIGTRIESLQETVGATREDIVDIRKHFWDDVTVSFEDVDDVIETIASMRQQAEVLSERERRHTHASNQLKKLIRLEQSPYFGRIDFKDDSESTSDRIYLGIATLLNEAEDEFLVYDWRAPVSSLYYDYPPGPAHYETPGGTVAGELELKRQYMIREGHIRSLFDTGVTIGDELLQEVLGKQADHQMKSIVATIQREQNQMIRNTQARLLVVQGAAGSGKTSAALQRVAYLLYRFREVLSANQIVLFSPNTMFNSYVSTVLPELGEENMQQTTFVDYLEHRLGRMFDLEDPLTQMEYSLTAMQEPGYEARIAGIQYKATTEFMEVLERYLSNLGHEGLLFKNIKFRGEVIYSADQLREQFYSFQGSLPLPNRMKLLADWLLQQLEVRAEEELTKEWVEEEIQLLDTESYLQAYRSLRKKKKFTQNSFDDYQREEEKLAFMVVQERFKKIRARVRRLLFLDLPGIYRQLFERPLENAPQHWAEICAQTIDRLDRAELAYEDATPYLFMKERIEGFQTNTSIRHVFVDEAQDYSAFQFAFLKRLFPRAKMTVLGDFNQAIYVHAAGSTGFTAVSALYPPEETEAFILTRSYRSTRPIVEFTRRMIPGGERIEPFNREGLPPTVTHVADHEDLHAHILDRIRSLQAAGHQNIAVICKTAAESRVASEALNGTIPVRLIGQETASFENGTVVIPAYLAKGVEFDAVILYNGSADVYGRESERRLFYTACTRAMHELHVYYTGEMSPFLQQAL